MKAPATRSSMPLAEPRYDLDFIPPESPPRRPSRRVYLTNSRLNFLFRSPMRATSRWCFVRFWDRRGMIHMCFHMVFSALRRLNADGLHVIRGILEKRDFRAKRPRRSTERAGEGLNCTSGSLLPSATPKVNLRLERPGIPLFRPKYILG